MPIRTFIVAGLLMCCASTCVLFAETVRLVNGKVISGKVLEMTDSVIRMEVNGAAEIIRRDEVYFIIMGSLPETKVVIPLVQPLMDQTPEQADIKKVRPYAIGFEVVQDVDPRLHPMGLSIYIQHVWKSGIGFQGNLGAYSADVRRDNSQLSEIFYLFPVIVNYHFFRDSMISPFVGIGLCRSTYYVGKYTGMLAGWQTKEKEGISPLADIGFALGADSPVRMILNVKYFVSLYTSKANMLTGGVGVSINW